MSKIVHFEIPAESTEKAREFYNRVFGWKFERWGEKDYWFVETGLPREDGIHGAITPKDELNSSVINTIRVEDIDMTLRFIQRHGGKLLTDKIEAGNFGMLAYFEDPDGNRFGIIEEFE